jgi:predicted nucleic acid-binding protein
LTVYLDSSAAAKLLLDEAESEALTTYLDDLDVDERLVSSVLLETELRRMGVRVGWEQSLVSDVLDQIHLVEPNRSLFTEAGLLSGANLRSLDALHVATALRLDARVVIAYDHRLQQSARDVGLVTAAPGQLR